MDDVRRDARGNGDENEQQEPVVGAAALRDGDDGQPGEYGLARHLLVHQRLDDGRERIDEIGRQNAGEETQCDENEHRSERGAVGFSRVLRYARSRPTEEGDAERLHEARGRQRRREGEESAHRRHEKFQHPLRQLRAQQNRLEGEPLRDEAVERRQG